MEFNQKAGNGDTSDKVENHPVDHDRVDRGTLLDISPDGEQPAVPSVKPCTSRQKFEQAQTTAHVRYSEAFQKLAE